MQFFDTNVFIFSVMLEGSCNYVSVIPDCGLCHRVAEVGEDLLVVLLGDGDVAVGVLSVGVA